MKITDIDIDKILFVSPFETTREEEPSGGFLKKLFGKKETSPSEFYKEEVKSRGVDLLREELTSEMVAAYQMQSPYQEYPVVITSEYLFFPGQDIVKLGDIRKVGLFNYMEHSGEHWQYAIDRMNEPYDPSHTSEYEGEETYEIDRFKVTFVIVDKAGQRFEYHFLMDKEDRPEFLSLILDHTGAVDYSDDDVLKGEFDEDYENNSRYSSVV